VREEGRVRGAVRVLGVWWECERRRVAEREKEKESASKRERQSKGKGERKG
jgi:hypothetical protein